MDPKPLEDQVKVVTLQPQGYEWSNTRIREQVTINVLSAVILALLTAFVAFAGSSLGLLMQHVFDYIVVPTHLLSAIVFISLGIVITLLLVMGAGYLLMRKYPALFAGVLLGALFGLFLTKSDARQKASQQTTDTNTPSGL